MYSGISNPLTQSCRYSSGCQHSWISSIANCKSAVAMVKVALTKRNQYSSMVRSKWLYELICYSKLRCIRLTILPPQSSGTVPLNEPFKTSVPACKVWTNHFQGFTLTILNLCIKLSLLYKWCCEVGPRSTTDTHSKVTGHCFYQQIYKAYIWAGCMIYFQMGKTAVLNKLIWIMT